MSDYAPASVLDFAFATILNAVPTTLAGSPVVSVYKDNSTTHSASGVTLTVDFDSITGSNHVRVDTNADGTFYSAGSTFQIVITSGTVGGNSLAGFVIDSFTLFLTSSIRPTTAGRTLDITATGAAGIDWGNIENQATNVNLAGTQFLQLAALGLGAIDANSLGSDAITKIQLGLMLSASYTAPDNTGISATNTNVATILSRVTGAVMLASSYTAPPSSSTITTAVWANATRTLSDKTGFSLAAGSIVTATFGAGATIPRVTLADTVTTYTGNTPQTRDVGKFKATYFSGPDQYVIWALNDSGDPISSGFTDDDRDTLEAIPRAGETNTYTNTDTEETATVAIT